MAGAAVLALAGFVLLNASAFMHAYRMTHFAQAGTRTASPERLSVVQKAGVLLTGVRIPKPRLGGSPADHGLSGEEVRLTTPDGIDVAAWHVPVQDGLGTVVLFHGYTSCKAALLPQAKLFHALRWDALLVDFRGCGDSSGRVTTLGALEARDVAAAVDWLRLRRPGRPIVLFGRSMGAVAVLRAIATQAVAPPAGLVLECPFDRLLTTITHRFRVMGVPAFPSAHLLVFWGGVQHGFNGFAHNGVDYARAVSGPALVLHGADDPRVQVAEVEAVRAALGGPAQLHIFKNVPHGSYIEANPAEYRRVLSRWLATLTLPKHEQDIPDRRQ
ncbi:MAG: alpha/beta fold hydrolase [Kiritimatiellae bacterium]|nr:alpha/beta fold hydrolase [Kiritimatiellia bacterium]